LSPPESFIEEPIPSEPPEVSLAPDVEVLEFESSPLAAIVKLPLDEVSSVVLDVESSALTPVPEPSSPDVNEAPESGMTGVRPTAGLPIVGVVGLVVVVTESLGF
jgi:hypothetical protein